MRKQYINIINEEVSDGFWGFYTLTINYNSNVLYLKIDTDASYKEYNHPIWCYIHKNRNPFETENLMCIDVNNLALLYNSNDELYIQKSELQYLLNFITNNKTFIQKVAQGIYTLMDLRKKFHNKINEAFTPLNEMSIWLPALTGLPFKIYVDVTGAGENSGHKGSPRLKFGNTGNPKSSNWGVMLLYPPYDIMHTPSNFKQKDINVLRKFVEVNQNILLSLYNKKIKEEDALDNLVILDTSGNFKFPKNYEIIKYNPENANTILFKDGTYNFELNGKILFNDNDGIPYHFNNVEDFIMNNKGKWYTYGQIADDAYRLFLNGKIISLNDLEF